MPTPKPVPPRDDTCSTFPVIDVFNFATSEFKTPPVVLLILMISFNLSLSP